MIFSGLEIVGGCPPQRDHPLDRARTRRAADVEEPRHRIDPLDDVARHGRTRRATVAKMTSTQDVRFSYGAVDEGWKLANKLWNAARLR